jgi:hypothetical protein
VVDIFGIVCGVFDTFEGHDKNGKFLFENALHHKKSRPKKFPVKICQQCCGFEMIFFGSVSGSGSYFSVGF